MAHETAHERVRPSVCGDGHPRLVTDGGTRSERHGIEFDRVLDAVADLGMDPSGREPIDGQVDDAATDGTLVEFPPGEYRVEERHLLGPIERYGWVGLGETHDEVRFTTSSGNSLAALVVYGGRDVLLENVTFDQGDRDHRSSLGNVFVVRDGLRVHDVEHAGFNPAGSDDCGEVTSLAVRVTDPDGVGVVERFSQTGPSNQRRERGAPPAIWYGNPADSAGTLYLRNCRVENAPGSGVHASHTNGRVHIEGGEFRNNGVANVRLAGEGSTLRGATVVVDTEEPHPDSVGVEAGSCGVWVEGGYEGVPGPVIEDTDLVAASVAGDSDGLVRIDANAGRTVVRDSRIRNDVTGVHTVYARRPGEWRGTPPGPCDVRLEGVEITGTGGTGRAVLIEGRDGSAVTDSVVRTERGDGVVFRDATDCAVERTTVSVPGRAVVYEDASGVAVDVEAGGGVTDRPLKDAEPSRPTDRLRIESADGEVVGYRLVVAGHVETDGSVGRLEIEETEQGSVVTGWVEGYPHRLTVAGRVEDAEFHHGDGRLYLNDERVTPAALTGEHLPRRLTVTSDGTGVASYEFTVDGRIAPDPAGPSYTPPENVSGPSAEGAVDESVDSYLFSGEVTSFSLRGLAAVHVDGRPVDPSRLGSSPDRDVLRVESRRVGDVGYRLTASGTLEPVSGVGPHRYRTDGPDTVVEGEAVPAASWATDGRFVGFDATDGSGRLFLNDALVGPADLGSTAGPHELYLSGPEGTSYEFTGPGTLGTDPVSHRFDGRLREFRLDGPADASISFRR